MIKPDKNFWETFKSTNGALSCTEAMAIVQLASLVKEGTAIELGSHKGKSGMAAAYSLKDVIFYLVDPIFEDTELGQDVSGKVFQASENWDLDAVIPINGYSINEISKYAPYSYVFWDSGEHAGEVLWKEKELLEDAVISGGIIVSHDIGNQFTQQTEAMQALVNTGKYEWITIDWLPIIDYITENNLEDGNNSWHIYPDNPFPNFVGAVRRK